MSSTHSDVRIKLTKQWDASLTYDVLKEDDPDYEPPPFVGRQELLGALVNAIEQPDRRGTYLVSGYRGAGKTTLVIRAAWQARATLEKGGFRLLPVVLNVSEVSASLSDAAEGVAPPLQIDARRLLTALLRALRNNVRDLPAPPKRSERDAEEVEKKVRLAITRSSLAAWANKRNGSDPFLRLNKRLDDTYRIANATKYVEQTTHGSESRLHWATESSLGISVPNVLKLIAGLASVLAVGFVVGQWLSNAVAVIAALATAAVVSVAYSRTVTREAARTENTKADLITENSIHQLENDLKDILTDLKKLGYRTIVVLEELDKVDDAAGRQLDAVIRYFKNLFTQAPALFFFLTDKQYYDLVAKKIDEARRRRTYSVEHTFFTHRVFVNRPTVSDCLEYLKTIACDKTEQDAIQEIIEADKGRVRSLSKMDLRERFLRLLLFRAQDHLFDLKNELRRYVEVPTGGNPSLVCTRGALSQSEQALAAFQFLVEHKARVHAFHGGGEYANEVLRNCLFAVFAESEPGEIVRMDRLYPAARGSGDQVTASEEQRIRDAVDALLDDLKRGGVIEVDETAGSVTWVNTAARFTPRAGELEDYEKLMAEKLTAHADSLAVLAEGGALHRVVSAVGREAQELVPRLKDKAEEPEGSDVAFTVQQTNDATAILEGEVAKVLDDAFEAHRMRLQETYGWSMSGLQSGPATGAWTVFGVTPGAPSDTGAVVLAYNPTEAVRQAVTASLVGSVPVRRLAIVTVVLPKTSENGREEALDNWRSALGPELAESTMLTAVSLDEGLDHANAGARWTDATADEIIVADFWVNEELRATAPFDVLTSTAGVISSTAASDTPHPSFRGAFFDWLAGSSRVLGWLAPPTPGVPEPLFANPVSVDGVSVAPAPAALVVGPSVDGELRDAQARRAAQLRLIGAGRLILVLYEPSLPAIARDQPLPAGARIVVPRVQQADPGLRDIVSADDVTTLRAANDSEAFAELARFASRWNIEHARRLLESAAAAGSTRALRELVHFSKWQRDEAAATSWTSELEASGDRNEIELLAEELAHQDTDAAAALYVKVAEAGSTAAMLWLATELIERDPATAKTWRHKLVESGDTGLIEQLAGRLEPRDPEAARTLVKSAAELGSKTAMRRLAVDLLDSDPDSAREWRERVVATQDAAAIDLLADDLDKLDPAAALQLHETAAELGSPYAMATLTVALMDDAPVEADEWLRRLLASAPPYVIEYAAGQAVSARPDAAEKWASFAAETGDADKIGAMAKALDSIDAELAARLRENLPPAA